MTNTTENIHLLMVGIGGYANLYLEALGTQSLAQLVAVVDPAPEAAPSWPALKAQQIPAFESIEAFLNSGIEVDLAVIASPISFHAEQSCALLKAGINVLCEKPIAATMEEAQRMKQAREASGKFLEIGYQWSFSDAIQSLKRDILDGTFGKAEALLTRVEWPRDSHYYNRNNWAGSIRNQQGHIVNDSPVNNATAHYLNNMLYLLGEDMGTATCPTAITAECYRANPIDNYDTCCCRIETEAGADIYFYTTHTVQKNNGPVFQYHFEKATIHYENGGNIIAHFKDGTTRNYGDPDANRMLKLKFCAEKCLDPSRPSISSVESVSKHTQCVEALQKVPVKTIPEGQFVEEALDPDGTLIYVPGMDDAVKRAFESRQLFSDLDLPWASPSTRVTV